MLGFVVLNTTLLASNFDPCKSGYEFPCGDCRKEKPFSVSVAPPPGILQKKSVASFASAAFGRTAMRFRRLAWKDSSHAPTQRFFETGTSGDTSLARSSHHVKRKIFASLFQKALVCSAHQSPDNAKKECFTKAIRYSAPRDKLSTKGKRRPRVDQKEIPLYKNYRKSVNIISQKKNPSSRARIHGKDIQCEGLAGCSRYGAFDSSNHVFPGVLPPLIPAYLTGWKNGERTANKDFHG